MKLCVFISNPDLASFSDKCALKWNWLLHKTVSFKELKDLYLKLF